MEDDFLQDIIDCFNGTMKPGEPVKTVEEVLDELDKKM